MKDVLRKHLQESISDVELKRWFDPLHLEVREDERRLEVQFPHAYFASWFEETARERFEERLAGFLGPGYVVGYSLCGDGHHRRLTPLREGRDRATDYPFGRAFTFSSFLTNRKNYFPVASAKEVARQKTCVFNPLVICGPPGSGKTHLLRAIANELTRERGGQTIFMGSMEDVAAIYMQRHAGEPMRARSHILGHEALLVDDFGGLREHPTLQKEMVVLFDAFHDQGKQMVFASRGRISGYEFLDPTLRSRLEWGLIVTLKEPDLDIRARYVQEQCRAKKLNLDKDQILLLAQRFTDFRHLQGILTKLFAFRELVAREIGPRDFEQILSHSEDKPRATLDPDAIIETVSKHFQLTPRDLKGSKRHHHVVLARQVAMYLCRELCGTSYPALGRAFGGKDHSTALYAVNKIKELQHDNRDMKHLVITLKEKCLSQHED